MKEEIYFTTESTYHITGRGLVLVGREIPGYENFKGRTLVSNGYVNGKFKVIDVEKSRPCWYVPKYQRIEILVESL